MLMIAYTLLDERYTFLQGEYNALAMDIERYDAWRDDNPDVTELTAIGEELDRIFEQLPWLTHPF